ncbi:MAG: sporulation initiation factor Spo0A C-terminal domain-containing protein [Limnochordia bacterium]
MIKVVLRDDDQEFCCMLREKLQRGDDIKVFAAEGDQDLLDLAAGIQPHVVVMDCMHPVERGIGLIQALIERQPEAQVLVMSRIEDDRFVHKLREVGAAYYLIKPFQPETLVERIKLVHYYHSAELNSRYGRARAHIQQFAADCLSRLGIPPHYQGYHYLLDAVLLASQDQSWLNGITKHLYPAVARQHGATAGQVERAIRYAIDAAWTKGDLDQLHTLFPYAIDPAKGKPTNSAFIAKMADIIKMRFSLP